VVSAFDGVIGHGQVLAMLEEDAARPAQAYLFAGPSSVGKATVARRFAALLLCDPGDPGCLRRVAAGVHPDLVAVEPDGRTSLTVEQARQTVARAVLAPVEADRKVFLFEEAGLMTDDAANTLLKTLEEPTPTTIFLLVVESEDELPPTIASRCRSVFFGRVPDEEITAALEGSGVEAEQARRAAATAGGRPGLAEMLATRPEVAAYRTAWLGVPARLTGRPGEAFRLAAELVAAAEPLLAGLAERQQAEAEQADGGGAFARSTSDRHERERRRALAALHVTGLEILASWYRDAAAAQYGAPVRNRDLAPAQLTTVSPASAVARASRVLQTIGSLDANQRPELALAALFSDLAAPS
jgi:DNA polymerase-3 subunit delta'